MRRRTRIEAWFFLIWGLLAAIFYGSVAAASSLDHAWLLICDLAAVAMWALLLTGKPWARNALVALLIMQIAGVVHNDLCLPLVHGRYPAIWVVFGSPAGLIIAWQIVALLTTNPREWGKEG